MNTPVLAAFAILLGTSTAAAQGTDLPPTVQAPTALPALRVPIHTAAADNGQSYGTWGAGDTYKASFHDGMTFVPYLGRDYPHNQPWSWRTTSAQVGNVELLQPDAPAEPWHSEYRYEYRFGAITEAYDVRADGLEQTFVVTERPTAGDLVIHGYVTSALRTENVAPAHRAMTFVDEDEEPILGYGAAIAIDTAGRRTEVTTSHHDGEIRLTVPDSWLATAQFPVTVDPLITTLSVHASSASTTNSVSVAQAGWSLYDVLLAFERAASSADGDVYAYATHSINTPIYTPLLIFSDITTSWDSDGPSCAYVSGAGKWVIVLRRYFNSTSLRRSYLRHHGHDVTGQPFSTLVGGMSAPVGYNDWRPDVGGVLGGNRPYACVVFQREDNTGSGGYWSNSSRSSIWRALVDLGPGGTWGTPQRVFGSSSLDCEHPSINKIAETSSVPDWICAFQSYFYGSSADDWDIQAKRINGFGGIQTGVWHSSTSGLNDQHHLKPVVEGTAENFAVLFASTDTASSSGHTNSPYGKKLWFERFSWSSTSTTPTAGPPAVELASNGSRVFLTGGLGFDPDTRSHWTATWRDIAPSTTGAYAARLGYAGNVIEGPHRLHAGNGTAPDCVYEPMDREFLFGWANTNASSSPVLLGGIAHPFLGIPPTQSGIACGQGNLSWQGSWLVGAEHCSVRCSSAATGAGHFMLVSIQSANLPIVDPGVVAGCQLLIDPAAPAFLGTLAFQAGSTVEWPFPLPGFLPTMTLHFQDWMLVGPQFTNTRRLSVDILR